MGDKFSSTELVALRTELIESGLDSYQTAEVLQVFLMGHGYGASPEAALDAATRVGGDGFSLQTIQTELDKLALVQ